MALLAARAWRLLATAAIVTAALLLAALWVAGPQTWSYYIQVVLPNWLTTPKMTVTAYQTIPAVFAHLLRADPQWNPDPLANRPDARPRAHNHRGCVFARRHHVASRERGASARGALPRPSSSL